MDQPRRRVIIVGGGFSGSMLAARLAEFGVACAVIDRSGGFGPGLAYSTRVDTHRLNVRSGRMGALEGDPGGFARWLADRHPRRTDPEAFAPRTLYGRYLQDRFAAVRAACPGLIETVQGEAIAVEGRNVVLDDGRRLDGDVVVIATGNPPPRRAHDSQPGRRIPDPWAPGALDGIGPADAVILLGSGLTMIDVLLDLDTRGWRGSAAALSRRGLLPRAHGPAHDTPASPSMDLTTGRASQRLRAARALARSQGWRSVMEGLRPVTASLWLQADGATRARWLRHLRPWWDAHRHRIPPDLAAGLQALRNSGRLRVGAGRLLRVETDADQVRIVWRPRGSTLEVSATADWLVDCTGPAHDPGADPLTSSLLAAGRARRDPHGLGLDVDGAGRLIEASGSPAETLFALGPPARAALWETVAVPDIRAQIERLAERLGRRD